LPLRCRLFEPASLRVCLQIILPNRHEGSCFPKKQPENLVGKTRSGRIVVQSSNAWTRDAVESAFAIPRKKRPQEAATYWPQFFQGLEDFEPRKTDPEPAGFLTDFKKALRLFAYRKRLEAMRE
jgi:hypothetical protein